MEWAQILASAIVGGIILFVWSGITNNLPWGIGSVSNVQEAPELGKAVEKQLELGKRSLFLSDVVAAIIVVRPLSYYSIPRYFALEFATQVSVALLLALIIELTRPLAFEAQMLLIAIIGLMASVGILFQYWNWWGFPAKLVLGSMFNLIIGWMVVSFVFLRFILV